MVCSGNASDQFLLKDRSIIAGAAVGKYWHEDFDCLIIGLPFLMLACKLKYTHTIVLWRSLLAFLAKPSSPPCYPSLL